jgi:hypothetical protein
METMYTEKHKDSGMPKRLHIITKNPTGLTKAKFQLRMGKNMRNVVYIK